MTKSSLPILEWDECQITARELESRLQEEQYFPDCWLMEYQQSVPKSIRSISFKDWVKTNKADEMREIIWEDSDFWDCEWEHLIQNLQEILDRLNPGGQWRIDGERMGWRHLSGWKYVDCFSKRMGQSQREGYSNGRKFLSEILPNTDCTFKIYEEGTTLRIVNFHHDAPCGETYFCKPGGEEKFEG